MIYQYDVQIINRQYKSIVQRFGASSQYAQPYTSRLIQMGAKPNKQGILQLPVYKKDIAKYNEMETVKTNGVEETKLTRKAEILQSNIRAMRKLSTTQEIKKRLRESLKAEGIEPEGKQGQYTESQLTERATLEDEIKTIIMELKGVAYNGDEDLQKMLKGTDRGGTNKGRLTYDEMIDIRTYYNYLRQQKIISEYPFE